MQDFTDQISAMRSRLCDARTYLRIDDLRARLPQLEAEASRPDLWDDRDKARKLTSELAGVNEDLEMFRRLEVDVIETETLHELAREELDESLEPEIGEGLESLGIRFADLEMRALFVGEFDQGDAVCQIKSGEGGTDAQDWAEIMMRMYDRWADRRGFELEITSASAGTEAGLSSIEFILKGCRAYGLMHAEHGVHRLVRISPFNNEGKRQTAFAAVQVAPFFEDVTDEIEIDEKELRIDTYRSSGAGGQHVNVTDSAVRITHLPTGIVTGCQNERSQHQNKERAMKMMAARLLDLERRRRQKEIAGITGEQRNVGFGSQIRSYVLQPYQMVKDLRSGHETAQVQAVLNGDVEQFMEAYLRWSRAGP